MYTLYYSRGTATRDNITDHKGYMAGLFSSFFLNKKKEANYCYVIILFYIEKETDMLKRNNATSHNHYTNIKYI